MNIPEPDVIAVGAYTCPGCGMGVELPVPERDAVVKWATMTFNCLCGKQIEVCPVEGS